MKERLDSKLNNKKDINPLNETIKAVAGLTVILYGCLLIKDNFDYDNMNFYDTLKDIYSYAKDFFPKLPNF